MRSPAWMIAYAVTLALLGAAYATLVFSGPEAALVFALAAVLVAVVLALKRLRSRRRLDAVRSGVRADAAIALMASLYKGSRIRVGEAGDHAVQRVADLPDGGLGLLVGAA